MSASPGTPIVRWRGRARHRGTPCRPRLLAAGLLLLGAAGPSVSAAGRDVRVGVHEARPLASSDEEGAAHGFCIDILEEIAAREGWRLSYRAGTWDECRERLARGEVDLVLPVCSLVPGAGALALSKESFATDWGIVCVRPGDRLGSPLDLAGRRVAVARADPLRHAVESLFSERSSWPRLVECDDYPAVFASVASGGADAGLVSRLLSAGVAEPGGLSKAPFTFAPHEIRIAVSPGEGEGLMEPFDRRLRELKEEPRSVYHAAHERWLGEPEPWQCPMWMAIVIGILASALMFSAVGSLLLRWQVRAKTRELAARNEELEHAVGERARAQKGLTASESRLQQIVDTIPHGIVLLDRTGTIVSTNASAERILGRAGAAMHGKSHRDETWFPSAAGEAQSEDPFAFAAVVRTGGPVYGLERTFRTPERPGLVVSVYAAPLRDPNGGLAGVVVSITDVTAQKASAAALIESERRFRGMFETMTEGVAFHDIIANESGQPVDYRIVDVNPAYSRHTGIARDRAIGRLASELYGTGEAPYLETYARVTSQGGAERFETYFPPLDRHFRISVFSPGPNRFVTIFEDITVQKRAEEALKRSEQEKATIMNSVSERLVYYDRDMRVLWANRAAAESVGVPAEGLVGRACHELWHERMASCLGCPIRLVWDTGERHEGELETQDGRVWHIRGYPVLDARGEIEGVVEVGLEITERKRAERDLAGEKERLSVTLRSIGDGVITTDMAGKVLFMNAVAERLTGWPQAEAAGRPLAECFNVVAEGTRERVPDPIESVVRQGGPVEFSRPALLIDRAGSERCITESGAPILDGAGRTIGVVLVLRDVTEKRLMEAELAKTEKLESLGLLAGGIAHDFNNILTAILGNLYLCRSAIGDGSGASKRLEEAERACYRARDLTRQLLTFSKGGAPVKTVSSLRDIIVESTEFALRGSKVGCAFRIADDLWPAEVDPSQISQVMQNLVLNADQAMPAGGTITIGASNVAAGDEIVRSRPGLRPGPHVAITVSDEGIGIPESHLLRIFDPFFTTKHKGSGLGLTTAYSIVRRHEGSIAVESTLGVGTTFTVYLPAAPRERAAPETAPSKVRRGRGRVLVMDDDDSIRDLLAILLKELGYEAVFTPDGAEAVRVFKAERDQGRSFDVVILDLTVPGGMGGVAAVGQLRAIDPHVKAIVASGYSTDPVLAEAGKYGFKGYIAKPFRAEDLSVVLARVIEGAPA